MTEHQTPLSKHHFLLRRLHSLSGIVPIGAFLITHLITNSSIVWGKLGGAQHGGDGGMATFQHEVNFIHSMPFLLLIEVFGLWLPIAFHSVLGVYYATTGRGNVGSYRFQANWRYSLQRLTGYFGLIFIFYHVATLRWGWDFLPFTNVFIAEEAASTTALALRGGLEGGLIGGVVVGGVYLIGITALVYHFANGLWTAAITWGLTTSAAAQKRWGYVCAGLGAALMLAGWSAYVGFVTLDIDEARAVEAALHGPAEGARSANSDLSADAGRLERE